MNGSGGLKMNKTQPVASWERQAETEKGSIRGTYGGLWEKRAGAVPGGVRDDFESGLKI